MEILKKKVGQFAIMVKEEIAGVEFKKNQKRIRELADPSTLNDLSVIYSLDDRNR